MPKSAPGDPDFPYMLADTPEEFERVRRLPMPCPSRLELCGVPCGCDGRNLSHYPAPFGDAL